MQAAYSGPPGTTLDQASGDIYIWQRLHEDSLKSGRSALFFEGVWVITLGVARATAAQDFRLFLASAKKAQRTGLCEPAPANRPKRRGAECPA
jgi:hypothetical protein